MGCCSSKLPSFPPSSAADGIAPMSPPDEFDAQLIKFIPQPGMFGNAIGVYLPNDFDSPSYFFQPTGGSYKLFKRVMEDKEEVCVIKSGWQSSDSKNHTDTFGNDVGNYTTSAKKTLTVVTKLNGMEDKVKVVKSYEQESGITVELDNGYSIQEKESQSQCVELTQNGNTIAHIYEKAGMMVPEMGSGGGGGGGPSGLMQNALAAMKAPVALYINRRLSETEMVKALTIIATANNRLIRTACLDLESGGGGTYYDDHDSRFHDNGDYDGGGGNGGGGGWGDWGGGDGGGDDGGGGE